MSSNEYGPADVAPALARLREQLDATPAGYAVELSHGTELARFFTGVFELLRVHGGEILGVDDALSAIGAELDRLRSEVAGLRDAGVGLAEALVQYAAVDPSPWAREKLNAWEAAWRSAAGEGTP